MSKQISALLVGASDSGKTWFMIALYNRLRRGIVTSAGTLTVKINDKLEDANKAYQQNLKNPTNTLNDTHLFVYLNDKELVTIKIIDAPGGYSGGNDIKQLVTAPYDVLMPVFSCEEILKNYNWSGTNQPYVQKYFENNSGGIAQLEWAANIKHIPVIYLFTKLDASWDGVHKDTQKAIITEADKIEIIRKNMRFISSSSKDFPDWFNLGPFFFMLKVAIKFDVLLLKNQKDSKKLEMIRKKLEKLRNKSEESSLLLLDSYLDSQIQYYNGWWKA